MASLGKLTGKISKAMRKGSMQDTLPNLRPDWAAAAQPLPKRGSLRAASYVKPAAMPKGVKLPGNYVIIEDDGVDYLVRKDLVNTKRMKEIKGG